MGFFLETPRIGFRIWTPDDLDLATQLWSDPEVTSLIGGPFSDDQIKGKARSGGSATGRNRPTVLADLPARRSAVQLHTSGPLPEEALDNSGFKIFRYDAK